MLSKPSALLVILALFHVAYLNQPCTQNARFLKFHRVRSCYKSSLPIIAWKDLGSLKDCMQFARDRRGLAFNYSPTEAENVTKVYVKNCQVFGCPEIGNTTTLVADVAFDYYSAYGDLNATENATCIRSVGLFDVNTQKLNQTSAVKACQAKGGDLADVTTDARTNYLSDMLGVIADWYQAAYVGLDDIDDEGAFQTPMGLPLKCTKFRAWSPGHPRKGRKHDDCVILDTNRVWRAINCKIKLGYICEFFPEPPQLEESIIKPVNCSGIRSKRRRRKCHTANELYQIYINSSRLDQCALLNDFN